VLGEMFTISFDLYLEEGWDFLHYLSLCRVWFVTSYLHLTPLGLNCIAEAEQSITDKSAPTL
jgi:hypothetical protein